MDYLGIFDDVASALDFDEQEVRHVITNLDELKKQLPGQVTTCLSFFPGVDRTVGGYEGLMAAQEHLPDNETRDSFAAQYSVLSRLWEALSPEPVLEPYKADYTWLTHVYESVNPPSGNGKLLWHALGTKTIGLVHENGSFVRIKDGRLENEVHHNLSEGLLWPEPLIQLNPSFEPGEIIDELAGEDILHEECRRIFQKNKGLHNSGEELRLHRHQAEAIKIAVAGHNYVLTTGTM